MEEGAFKLKLEAVTALVPYIRLVERERMRVPLKSEEDYELFFASDELNKLFRETIVDKLAMSQIVLLLRKTPLPTGEIARILGLTSSEISRHLNSSTRQGLVRYDEGKKCYTFT